MTDLQYPTAQGFHMPAEWEPHAATWLAWPHNLETWSAQVLPEVEKAYLLMMHALVAGEEVHVLVNDEASRKSVETKIRDAGIPLDRVLLHIIPTKDAWIRDYGPNFLVRNDPPLRPKGVVQRKSTKQNLQMLPDVSKLALRGGVAFNNWRFDSWGGKYDDLLNDDDVSGKIAQLLKVPTFEPGIVLEGGAIDVNGKGTCLTTEPCLLNPNRNNGLSRETMEGYLKNYLGIQKVIWLQGRIEGDDTDSHIDNLARFVNPTTILCACENDPSNPDDEGLEENYQTLLSATDQDGHPMNIIRLPMPGVIETASARLPASYANFYIGNRSVLLPVYDVPNDQKALSLLKETLPERDIVPIACRRLVEGLGAVHCITQQHPKGPV